MLHYHVMVENTGIEPVVPAAADLQSTASPLMLLLRDLAPEDGFEPPTRGFGDRCSANWNYSGLGGGGQIRTDDCRDLQSLALDHSATPP